MEKNIYFIISCKNIIGQEDMKSISFESKTSKTTSSEFLIVRENNNNFIEIKALNNSFKDKNIYLFNLKVLSEKGYENSIYVHIKIFGKKLKSSLELNKKVNHYFIYSTKFEYDDFFSFLPLNISQDVKDFVYNKFDIENYQKFLIFKEYLKLHEQSNYIDILLKCTIDEIYISSVINYEFILNFLIDLLKFEKDYSKVNQKLFESVISGFNETKKVNITKYNNEEYNKIISIIESYRNNFKKKPYILNLDIIILLFYQTNIRDKFIVFMNKVESKKSVIDYILKNDYIFKKYNCSEMEKIYINGEKIDVNKVINLSSTCNEYIKFFIKISEIKHNEIINIDLKIMPSIEINYEINDLKKFIKISIINEKLYFPSNKFVELIEKLNKTNYMKLLELKSIFCDKDYNNNWKTNKIQKSIKTAIHQTGKSFIENNKLNNLEIINFIQEDAKDYYSYYQIYDEYASLIGYININEINDEFKKQFNNNNYDYQNLMKKKNYPIFINSIFKKVYSFRNLKTLYELFNLNNKQNQKEEILIEIINIIYDKKLNRDDNDFSKEIKDIIKILFNFIIKKKNFFEYLLDGLKSNLSEKEIDEICLEILNNSFETLKKDNKDIIDKLIDTICPNKQINSVLAKFKNNREIQKYYLSKKEKEIKIVTEEELFDDELSKSLKDISTLIKYKLFTENNYEDINIIKEIKKFMNIQFENLNNLNFKWDKLKQMRQLNLKKSKSKIKNLKNRIFIISLGNKKDADELYELINSEIKNDFDIYNNIDKIINIFSTYYPNEKKDIIEQYKGILFEIKNKPIREFPKKVNNLDENYKIADELDKLKNSKFFIRIFEIIKDKIVEENNNIENDSLIVDKTKKEFDNLEKLFNSIDEDTIDIAFLEIIVINIDIDEINKEIKILSDIRKIEINENTLNTISKKIILLKNRYKKTNILKKIILLLNDYNLKDGEITKTIEKVKNELEKIVTLNKLLELETILNKVNLKILNESIDNNKYLIVIDKMYEKPELIAFIKDKPMTDIHQMGELIDDSEDVFITISDLTYLEGCKKFLDDLSKFNSSEKELLDNFITLVDTDNDIGMKFGHSSSKYHDFHELYIKHLNQNEMNKQNISVIYSSSIWNLIPSYPCYICQVNYMINDKNKIKDFKYILDLNIVALMRKKDQKDVKYLEKCNTFSDFVNDIKKILDILNSIFKKGYYEELSYRINIEEGICIGYKNNDKEGKNLREIIEELNHIKEEQLKYVNDKYETNPNTRMIYGKQFEYINKYCLNQAEINLNSNTINILKYICDNKKTKEVRDLQYPNEENKIKQMYENVDIYLNNLYQINGINLNDLFKNANIDKTKKGIFTYSCSLENIENSVIHCSLYLTGNFPVAYTLLYCNNSTTEEEIISFIYKSVKCELNILFIIIKPEKLDINKKNLLIGLLRELYQKQNLEMNSCLLFVYSKQNRKKEVIIEIEKLPNHHIFVYEDEGNYKDIKFPEIEIYTSSFSGLGKSTLIEQNLKQYKNYEYHYFPIGGDLNRNEIIERLMSLINKKIALHLDLSDSNNEENVELLREFLFRFLILKHFSQEEKIFYYGNDIKIKVEIPKSFMDYFKIFPFLNFFKIIKITPETMPELIVSNDINSKDQIVCNYIKNINLINEKEIYFQNLTNEKSSNLIIPEVLNSKECLKLIRSSMKIENPNFYQINSYISLVGEQLELFTKSIYLSHEQLEHIYSHKHSSNLKYIRYFFVNSLLSFSKYVITSSYENIIKEQINTYQKRKGDIEKSKEEAIKCLSNKVPFCINNIRPSMIIINEDGQTISIILTCDNNCEEYFLLKEVYNSDNINVNLDKEVLDYKKLSGTEMLVEIRKILDLKNPIDESDNEIKNKKKTLKSITKSYVFTADNVIKLIIISLRLRTDIPVIMMGETGCGKTSLIKIIDELKDIKMLILNIHAGIEDKDIIKFINDNNLFIKNGGEDNIIWVFFDEINTCNSLSLITEIFTKKSCKGEKIKSNVKFIAACNPYRLNTQKKEIIGLYDESKYKSRELVYNVNPLPIPLLNFVYDFGTPEKEDIKRYIDNMVSNILEKIISEPELFSKIKNISVSSIFDAHEFIKNNFEISSVSLREIRRWGILFEWFYNMLKNPYFSKRFNSNDNEKICIHSLNLSLYICYYIRIYDKKMRNQFSELMTNSFGAKYKFTAFPEKIQNIIADSVELGKGIAKNKTILQNLFVIFVCLNTKIPLFIIGKPGCSKSLSAQIIFRAMNGKDSSNEFFKYYPKVYTKSYQGSETSNSKGIKKIFEKARKSYEDGKLNKEIISAVYFDEVGLAEISPNNPLKVIHFEIEYDDNEDKVALIGISNWALDASKMNRGIYLSIPEPDVDDLIFTAYEIAKSYDIKLILDYKEYFMYLAKAYYQYKEELKCETSHFEKKIPKNTKEFHGTRDFYHLIKITSRLLIEKNYPKDNEIINNILNKSIERNFGGLENSIKIFKGIFKKIFDKYNPNINEINKYNVMECIKENINDYASRYLLIVTKSPISQFLLTSFLDNPNEKYNFYYGSNFQQDTSESYYSAKILNKIQVTMSCDNIMILKNLSSVFPSLYDLFNQNFRTIGENDYARIALGDSNTQNYFINKKFRCIILFDKNEIDKQDPPLLNRFEKHVMSVECLLSKRLVKISKQIHNIFVYIFNKLIENEKNQENKIKIDLKNQQIHCDLEEIQGLIYEDFGKKKKEENIIKEIISDDENQDNEININEEEEFEINEDTEKYKEKIFRKIIPTFSQDLIFSLKFFNSSKKYKKDIDNIIKIYLENEEAHKNLKSYLENIDFNKHIIYTFSNIFENLEIEEIQNNKYNNFSKNKTKIIFVESNSSEGLMDNEMDEFYNKDYNLCIFHFNNDVCIHLNHINYLLEAKEVSYNNNIIIESKVILFIIHLERKTFNDDKISKIHDEYLISPLTKSAQIFIDNLNGKNVDMKNIINSSNIELFNQKELINLDEEFEKNLYHAFSCLSYNTKINLSDIQENEYIEKVCEYINKDNYLKILIQKIVMNKINNIDYNIIKKIFTDYNFEENDVDFISVISKYMKSLYNNIFIDSIIHLEEENILSTRLLGEKEMNNDFFNIIYEKHLNKLDLKAEYHVTFSERVKIDYIFGISYPFIISVFNEINSYININKLLEDYKENDDKYRAELFDNEEDYTKEKNRLENNIIKELEKYFSDIFNENKNNFDIVKLQQILFNDYIIYYLSKSNDKLSNKKLLNLFDVFFTLFLSQTKNNNFENMENNENIYSIKNISKFILFIESYKDIIYPICSFLFTMDSYINNFINDFIKILSSETFKMKDNTLAYVNDIFFNIFESIVYCFFNYENPFKDFSDEQLNNFLNEVSVFSNIIMKANIELRLTLKNILFLSDFLQIKESLNRNGISLKDNLHLYLNILKKEIKTYLIPQYTNVENEEKANDNENVIDEEFSFLKEKLSQLKEYPNIISKLLYNKIRISKEEKYRIKILKILFSNNLFIIKIKIIFDILLSKYNICPIDKDENEDNIENEEEEDKESEGNNDYDGEMFLSELSENKNDSIIEYLNKTDNECFDEILLSLFDGKFVTYFQNKKKAEEKVLNQSFEIFKKCILHIENKDCKISGNKLGFLYCISFIKYYCFHFGKILIDEDYQNIFKDEIYAIYSFLNEKSEGTIQKKFREVIKIYILKVINLIHIKNYNKFLEEIKEKNIFFKDFVFKEKENNSLDNLFINENFDYYKELREKYLKYKMNKYKENNEILKMINTKDFLYFYDLIINEEISNLENNFKTESYPQLYQFLLDVLNKLNISNTTKEILLLFYDRKLFKDKIIPSIKSLPSSLYSHKFAVISSMSLPETFYSEIISPKISENIKNLYIPGGEPNFTLKMVSLQEIENLINMKADEILGGFYMCSCGSSYFVDACRRPTETYNCKNCGQVIGGEGHKIKKREGHTRILFREGENYSEGETKTLNQLRKEVENEKSLHFKGILKVGYDIFKEQNKKVRNMHNVTYRILSYIFYSCLFYCEKLQYITKDNFNYSFFDGNNTKKNNISFILEELWEILIEELKKEKINNIECFLNMIMPELSKVIIENKYIMNNNDEREKFEGLCNNIIIKSISKYNNYDKTYTEYINKMKEIKDISIKSIIEEKRDINNLPEYNYPLMKYFHASNYPDDLLMHETFGLIMDSQIKYPVLTNYVKAELDESIQLLQNLNDINPFVNCVLNKYSNKITREEAKKRKIREELENDNNMKILFESFQKSWEKISAKLTNYDCRGELSDKKTISENDCLAYFLNDNFENDYGIYIATIYKVFITYQNDFLKDLVKNKSNNEYLHLYSNQIKREIIIQKAKKYEIVSLDISNSLYKSFDNLIYSFSYRNCFNEDGTINYLNYKEIKFDFDSIEKELSKIILPGKRLFSNEKEQNFITYALEGFNQNENIILDFIEKIKDINYLTKEEKDTLLNILRKVDYKLILFNLQSLFLYFVRKKNIDGTELLNEELDLLQNNNIIKLDEEIFNIFSTHFKIKVNQLIDCYEFVEFYNYDKIILNVPKKIRDKLNKEQIKQLDEYFSSKENYLINKNDLGNAVRKYICRYLVGDRFQNIYWNIFIFLKEKKELWNENINIEKNEAQFKKEIGELESFNIYISQAIDFYEKLGGERAEQEKNNEKNTFNKNSNKIKKKKAKTNLDY